MPNFVPSAATEGRPAQKKKWGKKMERRKKNGRQKNGVTYIKRRSAENVFDFLFFIFLFF
jgi:hypothetical protein